MKKLITALLLFCGMGLVCMAQDTSTPTQHFVISGSVAGQPAAISSAGFQLTKSVSLAYEYISNPSDSTKTRIGSGVANFTKGADSFLPKSLKLKLLIDPSNYNVTFQAGVGRTSEFNANGPRIAHLVGNFGIYGSKPLPGGHTQIGFGYKWIVGPGFNTQIKVPVGVLNFTF